MKTAQNDNGQLIEAGPTAPSQAVCPRCGGTLTLRYRHGMGKDKITYFWRHASNDNRHCSARNGPHRR
ncbi:MAG: hypothetical protein AB1791_13980 [Chloroflexota bacterium]